MKPTPFSRRLNRTNRQASLGFLAALTMAGSAHGASLAAAQPYNLFVFGNLTEFNSDSEGRVAAGGNTDLTNYGIGSAFQGNLPSAGTTLVVGGNLSYNNGQVFTGSVVHGGTYSPTGSVTVPNGTVSQGSVIDFAAAKANLTSSSAYWSGLTVTGTPTNNFGSISMIGTDPDLNVFFLAGSVLDTATRITIDAPFSSTVLINIDGTTNTFKNLGFGVNDFFEFADTNLDETGITDKQHVLYNFYESTSLTVTSIGVKGSILAPLAHTDFTNGHIDGNLVTNSLAGNGEAHNYLFQGNLPAIPEPSSAGLAALALVMVLGRRKRSV